ncbi:hypothetical protein [Kamptonema formosum]|nr:hypothetical protein [Oscillatoria sp. PCC 10802]
MRFRSSPVAISSALVRNLLPIPKGRGARKWGNGEMGGGAG